MLNAARESAAQMRIITTLAVITLVLLYITAGLLNWWGYHDVQRDAERQLTTLDMLLAEETARAIDGVKLAVDTIGQDLQSANDDGDHNAIELMASGSLQRSMNRVAILLPQMSDVIVRTRDGVIRSTGRSENVFLEDVLAGVDKSEDGIVYFGSQHAPEDSYLAIMRRIETSGGDFIGVVVGLLPVSYFQGLYNSLGIGDGGTVSLWWNDGTLLAQEPRLGHPGERKESMIPRLVSVDTPAVFRSTEDGIERLTSIKGVRGYPLAVAASYSMSVVFAAWWRTLLYSFAGSIFLTLLAGLLIMAVWRRFESAETIRRVAQKHQKAVEERERIAEQLRQSQKLEVVGQLTAGIAHDFNNLLTVVIGNLEVVDRRLARHGDEAMSRRAVESAMNGARKAATLTHRLLAFARKQPLTPKSIDVPSMLTDIVELLRRTLGEGVSVTVDAADEVWPVYVDVSQLENALVNLAVNSRDAMPDGGRVTIGIRNAVIERTDSNLAPGIVGDFVAISVKDTGQGMASDVANKAFEPFFSTKEVGKGSGLGLSQIYGFAKQSGGDCTIQSKVGEGTVVTMYLPRSAGEAEEMDEDGGEVVRGRGETILVVDDSPQVRDYAVRALRELGYLVRQADDPNEALSILGRNDIDCLLTDVGLPGMDGVELATEARRRQPGVAVVFMTAYADKFAVVKDAFQQGQYAVLEKPFRFSEISQAVASSMREEMV